jgi:Virulence factor BrkB
VAYTFDVIVGIVLSTNVFAMIYKLMPRVDIDWKDVWIGAVVHSLLLIAAKFLIGVYLGLNEVSTRFGASRVRRRGPAVGVLLGPGLLFCCACLSATLHTRIGSGGLWQHPPGGTWISTVSLVCSVIAGRGRRTSLAATRSARVGRPIRPRPCAGKRAAVVHE